MVRRHRNTPNEIKRAAVPMRMLPIFKQIVQYFSAYKKYIGMRLYIVFVLSAVAAATEGFGIAMLLPLIDAAGVGVGSEAVAHSGVRAGLHSILNVFGIGNSLVGILLFIGFVFLIKGLIVFAAYAYEGHLTSQLMREITVMLFDKYSSMDYRYYTKRNTGHFINMVTVQNYGLIRSFEHFKQFLTIIITTMAYLVTSFFLDWAFALMALGAGVILLFLFRGLNNYVHGLSRKTVAEHGRVNKFLVQTMQSFKYLASTAQLGHVRSGVTRSVGSLAGYMRSYGFARALTVSLTEPIAIFFVLLVIIIQVATKAPLVPIFVALVLFNRAMVGILSIQQAWQATLNKVASLETVEEEFRILAEHQEPDGNKCITSLRQGIELRDVSFAYDAEHGKVLKGVSLTIPVNSTVAFVGESGAGKSTIVDMLTLLLRPQQGEIFIDGVPSREVNLGSWRSKVGYVSQETVVFDDTIANNISLWKDDYGKDVESRNAIELAASQAFADNFIQELPSKYQTEVGDRGVRLSGGQRQRLFLARELYKHPSLLILDEATSALDSESEKYIQESIEALKGHATVVIIAHRLSTIKHADYIYVLDKGQIIEQGKYDDLLAAEGGRFKRMVDLQSL